MGLLYSVCFNCINSNYIHLIYTVIIHIVINSNQKSFHISNIVDKFVSCWMAFVLLSPFQLWLDSLRFTYHSNELRWLRILNVLMKGEELDVFLLHFLSTPDFCFSFFFCEIFSLHDIFFTYILLSCCKLTKCHMICHHNNCHFNSHLCHISTHFILIYVRLFFYTVRKMDIFGPLICL